MQMKPYILMNMAMSADGKISSFRRESFPLGSKDDRKFMNELRAGADAVIIGGETLRVDGFPILVRDEELKNKRLSKGLSPQPLNVVLSSSLDLPLGKPFFHHPETRRIVFTGNKAPEDRIKRIEHVAEVVVLGSAAVAPRAVVSYLTSRGIKRIIIEGGGEINFSFLKAHLVDEIFITVTPLIIGGTKAPTVVDGRGFLKNNLVRLKLISARRIKDEVFLRFKIVKKRGSVV